MTEPTPGWAVPGGGEQPSVAAPPPVSPYGPPPVGPAYGAVPHQAPAAVPSLFAPPPVGGLGVAVLAVSGLYVVTMIAQAVLAFPARSEALAEEAGAATGGFFVAALVSYAALVAAWVLTSVWLMRGYRAAYAASPLTMRRSIAWTWLGWLVPIVSLWFPKQVVDDVWWVAAAQPGREPRGTTGGWWFWWLLVAFFNGAATNLGPAADGFAGFAVFAAVIVSIAYLFWFRVVRRVSAAHDAGPWSTNAFIPPRD